MNYFKHPILIFALLCLLVYSSSCHHPHKNGDPNIVTSPEKMDKTVKNNLQDVLEYAVQNNGRTEDSLQLPSINFVNKFYTDKDFESIWSHNEKWNPLADSLYNFIQTAAEYGLFRNDYHFKELTELKNKLDKDSTSKNDAALWTNADILLTDGFMHLAKDLKVGRISSDSIFMKNKNIDSVLTDSFYTAALNELLDKKQLTNLYNSFEPKYSGYKALKAGIGNFLDSMDRNIYTYIPYPFNTKILNDSLNFIKKLQVRLNESKCILFLNPLPKQAQLDSAIKKYQQQKRIKVDGKISLSLIKNMNDNDLERFKSIAINLDRYKQMPDTLPENYVWVNLPGYYLNVWDHDTLVFNSKVICGKPSTPTPLLVGNITNMVTYPTWTVPNSIIVKQYLPKLKVNAGYLNKIGLHIIDRKGDIVNPFSVKWSKYKKGIPYNIVQGSGDDNSLGVMKFNFNNPYSVYLHDTNQRYLFKNTVRDLSHGCVRVQEWEKLAFYLITNDSLNLKPNQKAPYNIDSITTILQRKEKKTLPVKNKLSLYILYFTCEGKDGKIIFYNDMYDADKAIKQKYFANKS